MKKQNAKRESFWERLTKRQLRVLRGGDAGGSSSDSSSGSSSTSGAVPVPPSTVPPVGGL